MKRLLWFLPLLATAALAQTPYVPLARGVIHKASVTLPLTCSFGLSPSIIADDTATYYVCTDDTVDTYAAVDYPLPAGVWMDYAGTSPGLTNFDDPILSYTGTGTDATSGWRVYTQRSVANDPWFECVQVEQGVVTCNATIGSGYGGTNDSRWKFSSRSTPVMEIVGNLKASKYNLVTVTQPATGSTLTIAEDKTLTVNKTLTLTGTDSTTQTFPSTSATIARTDASQAFTGVQTFNHGAAMNAQKITGVLDPTAAQDAATKAYVDLAVASLDLNEFFTATADALGGLYCVMDTAESAAGTVVSPTITSSTTTGIFNWITPAGHPHLTRLIAGVYDIHTHLLYTKGAGSARTTTVYCELYTTDAAGGTQVKVGTSAATAELTTSDTFYDIYMNLGTEVTMATTDRLALKFFAVTTGGTADTTVTMTVGGTADPHLSISIQGQELDQIFVPYTGATHDLDMGSFNITGYKKDNVSATDKLLGRSSAGAGAIEEITLTAAGRAILDDATAAAQRATVGALYALPIVSMLNNAPADGVTYYAGGIPVAMTNSALARKTYFRKAGIVRVAEVMWYGSGAAGTNENISIYVRLNDTTDYLIATVGAATAERNFTNTSINVTVASGDFFEIKIVCPTWATNPVTVGLSGYLLVE